jgi:predicted nucleic-acid-binding protein
MIGLDTNVLVRYIAQDDARQSAQANRLIESFTPEQPGHVSLLTLAETVWVLQDLYGTSRERVVEIVETLLQTQTIVVGSAELVWQALAQFRRGKADFADHLIERLDAKAGCSVTMTFDRAAARDAGMTRIGA